MIYHDIIKDSKSLKLILHFVNVFCGLVFASIMQFQCKVADCWPFELFAFLYIIEKRHILSA